MTYGEATEKFIRECVVEVLNDSNDLPGACLYYAAITNLVTGAPIVAGSYSWRVTNFDDGNNPTHFSCIFDHVAKKRAIELMSNPDPDFSVLPEMHVWNLVDGKVLDLSTAHIQDFAARMGWRFDPECIPPSVHFAKPIHRKGRWIYEQDILATKLAKICASRLIEECGLKIERK